MSNADKISGWRSKIFVWLGLPVIAVLGLTFGGLDLVPAWQAKAGNGTPGTFTAVHEECSRRSCNWYGDFKPDQGGSPRTDVILYDEPDGLRAGGTVQARDTGARNGVFSTAGGSTWLLVTGFVLGGVIAAAAWVVVLVRAIRRRGAGRQAVAG